jgi:exodeoxyribonuclease V alpha subunit
MSSPTSEQSLTGTVERITFHNEENGFAILKVMVKGRIEPVTVKGCVATVQPGERLEAVGQWVSDPTYGRQFAAAAITTTEPSSLEGIRRYLGSGLIDGIGPKYAERLVAKFGERVFDVIEHQSGKLEDVEGIGTKRRIEIKSSWEKQKAVRQIMVFLHQYGVSTARAVRIYKRYGDTAIAQITANPYRLAEDVWGIGFKTADEIAARLGVEKSALSRLRAGLQHVLLGATDDGHCALPAETLLEKAGVLLGAEGSPLSAEQLTPALAALLAEATLIEETVSGVRLIFLPYLVTAEQRAAGRLLNMVSRPPEYPRIDVDRALTWVAEKTGKDLAPGQQDAIRAALKNRLLVITGGPGVGKTTIMNSLLRILEAKGVEFVLAAPTGRAAKRLSESTGHEAKTLHRLLEYQPAKGWGRDEERPLKGTLFVLDEVSMVDTSLLWHFLKALPVGAHLVLVGDVDQLPSVGPGRVLADIIDSRAVPVVRLTEIFRQAHSSRIVTAAHAVNAGQIPDLDPPADGTLTDFFFVERDTPEAIAEALITLIRDRIPQRFGLDARADVQVLTPMNRGRLGAHSLNTALQEALNAPREFTLEAECFGTLFRAGDKVIQTRNNYDKDVFNGDIGRLTEIAAEPVRATVQFEDGREATYEAGDLDELRLAYAITIHKSQGSEFPAVVIPLSTQHYMMLQRNLLYTGLTRGKKLVILVGTREALSLAVRRADARKRWTTLRERLAP